jgi:hypothetical protein
MNICFFCKHKKYNNSDEVNCQYYNKIILIHQEVCAAKELNKYGWEDAAKQASKNGEIERAYLYNEIAKKNN